MHPSKVDLTAKIRALPASLFQEDALEAKETHISIVLLGRTRVYKFKKPVDLGFICQTSLEERLLNCRREVELNRRLAPDVYLGVGSFDPDNMRISLEYQDGLEPFVVMRRLKDEENLLSRTLTGSVTRADMRRIARRIGDFHAAAERGPEITARHHFRENIEDCLQTVRDSGLLDPALDTRIESFLESCSHAVRMREKKHRIVNGHGDIRLDHVYLHGEEVDVIDCTEFNASFRSVDPLEDAAFLSMALAVEGHEDLAETFVTEYFSWTADCAFPDLYRAFEIYRAAVRAKVDTIMQQQARERGETDRVQHFQERIQRYLAFIKRAVSRAPTTGRLAIFMGLPASGKSRRAQEQALDSGSVRLATDIVRKRMTGLAPLADGSAAAGRGLYSLNQTDRTYRRVRALCLILLRAGYSVTLDAMFAENSRRLRFARTAERLGIRPRFVEVHASLDLIQKRLERRKQKASVSDMKDFAVWQTVAASFEQPSLELRRIADVDRLESKDD
jgi:aminoglycoside phosphotransferase family enzyme/predicted kinase